MSRGNHDIHHELPLAIHNLPFDLIYIIFERFTAEEIVQYLRVCKAWNVFLRRNELWWRLAMEAWHLPEDRPTKMTRHDHKRKWMESYLSITGLRKAPVMKKEKVKPPPKVWDAPEPTKLEMRAHYKELSHGGHKVRGKSPPRVRKDFLHTFADNE